MGKHMMRKSMFLISDADDAATEVMIQANQFDESLRPAFYARVIEELKEYERRSQKREEVDDE